MVNTIFATALFLTAGLIMWPITIGAIVAVVIMSPLERKMNEALRSFIVFILMIIIAGALGGYFGYPIGASDGASCRIC